MNPIHACILFGLSRTDQVNRRRLFWMVFSVLIYGSPLIGKEGFADSVQEGLVASLRLPKAAQVPIYAQNPSEPCGPYFYAPGFLFRRNAYESHGRLTALSTPKKGAQAYSFTLVLGGINLAEQVHAELKRQYPGACSNFDIRPLPYAIQGVHFFEPNTSHSEVMFLGTDPLPTENGNIDQIEIRILVPSGENERFLEAWKEGLDVELEYVYDLQWSPTWTPKLSSGEALDKSLEEAFFGGREMIWAGSVQMKRLVEQSLGVDDSTSDEIRRQIYDKISSVFEEALPLGELSVRSKVSGFGLSSKSIQNNGVEFHDDLNLRVLQILFQFSQQNAESSLLPLLFGKSLPDTAPAKTDTTSSEQTLEEYLDVLDSPKLYRIDHEALNAPMVKVQKKEMEQMIHELAEALYVPSRPLPIGTAQRNTRLHVFFEPRRLQGFETKTSHLPRVPESKKWPFSK